MPFLFKHHTTKFSFQAKLESPTEPASPSFPQQQQPEHVVKHVVEKVRRSSSSSLTVRRLNSIACACDGAPMPETETTSEENVARAIAGAILEDVLVMFILFENGDYKTGFQMTQCCTVSEWFSF